MTMYDKRPTRWRYVPRRRGHVFLRSSLRSTPAGERVIETLPVSLPDLGRGTERAIFSLLIEISQNRGAVELDAQRSCHGAEALAIGAPRLRDSAYDPDYPRYSYDDVVDTPPRAELEAADATRHGVAQRVPMESRG